MIEAVDLAKHHGSVAALDGVSFTIEPGEFVAVHGPSGCGKTTLLHVLGALQKPSGGSLDIGQTNPYALSPRARARFRARNIGFVFQHFHLLPYLSVLDNVLAPTLATRVNNARTRATSLLEELGLAGRHQHVPSRLSAGEQQRTALARALITQPKLILADEPTGNLDHENATHVLDQLADYAKTGAIVLMVTHDEHTMKTAGRRIGMDQGHLV